MQVSASEHQELLAKIPELEIYKKNLQELRELDLSEKSEEEIETLFNKLAIYHPIFLCIVPKDEFNKNIFYRVRNIKPRTEEISLIRTFPYPSPSLCHSNGRANVKGKSVFYASDYAIAAMLESRQKEDEMGFLSFWKPAVDRDVRVALFLPKRLRGDNPWYDTAIQLHDHLSDQTIYLGKEKKEQLDLLNEFVCDQFVLENKFYCLTSWLSNKLLYRNSGIDVILYPSTTTHSTFCNFAFHPNFIDNFMTFEKALMFNFEGIENSKINYDIGSVGIQHLTNIHWEKPINEQAQEYMKIIESGLAKDK
jgi:RES domain